MDVISVGLLELVQLISSISAAASISESAIKEDKEKSCASKEQCTFPRNEGLNRVGHRADRQPRHCNRETLSRIMRAHKTSVHRNKYMKYRCISTLEQQKKECQIRAINTQCCLRTAICCQSHVSGGAGRVVSASVHELIGPWGVRWNSSRARRMLGGRSCLCDSLLLELRSTRTCNTGAH